MKGAVHATTVAINGRGVLIAGPSGAGKSDLALRLIDRGALLVADDRTALARTGDRVYASAPATIAGKMEVRGVGIVDMPQAGAVPVALAVALGTPERLPALRTCMLAGVPVPEIVIDAHAPSAAIKVELALKLAPGAVA
jgi:serine kinase of HPr protein (carbohydrate metabolism regulator)